jgi:predicted dehydrogenase
MVAQVLPFFPEFALALRTIRDGRFGRLRAATFKRVIAKPDWSAAVADAAQTGGPAVDLHIHDTHFIRILCGMPQAVFSTGCVEGETVVHLATQYLYGPEGPSVTCTSGALAQPGRPFVHGYELYLEGATLTYESGVLPPTLFTASGAVELPELPGGADPIAAFAAEISAAVEGVIAGRVSDLLHGSPARDALVLCHKECESARSRRAVAV